MITALILAAGASRRLGQPKALLKHRGSTMVQRTVRHCIAAGAEPLVLFGAQVWPAEIDGARWLQVPESSMGMGATIAAGVAALAQQTTHCLVVPVDLPTLTADHLRALMHACDPVSASILPDGRVGSPACFARACLPELAQLRGDVGARHLLRGGRWPVTPVTPPSPLIDIDTPADWSRFLQANALHTEMPCS